MVQTHASAGQLLQNASVRTTITTTDIPRSLAFWRDTVGLTPTNVTDDDYDITCGNGTELYVYKRNEAPLATNTVCSFQVTDLETTVNALRDNGVTFEEYDLPGLKTVNGIADMGTFKGAWFKDPDGNIIAISTR